MSKASKSLVLIGMPGSGKSTLGVLLAKAAGLAFVDSDIEIQLRENASLQELVDSVGYLRLREIEEDVLSAIPLDNVVLATGGSAVYSEAAMRRLADNCTVIYLKARLDTIVERISANPLRGIASNPNDAIADIYAERTPLYERYADSVVEVDKGSVEEIVQTIGRMLAWE
jgi:shikimate kinase